MFTRVTPLRSLGALVIVVVLVTGTLSCLRGRAPRQQNRGTGLVVTPREEQRASLVGPVFGIGTPLPHSIDLAQWLPPAGDQGDQNACVGFALGYGLKTFHEAREHGWDVSRASRQFSPAYIFDRINLGCDVGASLKDGLDLLINEGCPTIDVAPYDPTTCSAHTHADFPEPQRYRIRSYKLIAGDDLETVKLFLAAEVPVVLGIRAFDRWFELTADDCIYDAAVGGEPRNHVVLAIGYDDSLQAVKVLNSFGPDWGDGGYAWIDYDLWERVVKIAYVTEDEAAVPLLSFYAPQIFDVEVNPFRVELGDLDADGDLDAVALSFSRDNFAVLLNDGRGAFVVAAVHPLGEGPFAGALGDLDGDGDLDVVVANLYSADVSIALNEGQGSFATPITLDIGGSFLSDVALADVDADEDLDLLAVNFSRVPVEQDIVIVLNHGDASFADPDYLGGGAFGRSFLFTGDLDGDGDQDFVTVNGLGDNVSVFLNDGNGTFAEAGNYAHEGGFSYGATQADLDGDGDLDLVIAHTFQDRISVLANDGQARFTEVGGYPVSGNGPFDVTTADLDHDGDLDLAVVNPDSNDLAVLLNSGTGTFSAPITFGTGGLEPTGLAAGDLDNDGDADLMVMNNALFDGSVLLNQRVP